MNSDSRQTDARGPSASEETLSLQEIQIERKSFVFALKENGRGRFLRITEQVAGRRESIIIPSDGLEEFKRIFAEMAKAANEMPSKGE